MEIDLKKFDEISKMEDIIEKKTKVRIKNINKKYIINNYEQQMIYILTIITMLYKEKNYNIYLAEKSKKIDQKTTQELLDNISILNEIIKALKQPLMKKETLECISIINIYADIIEDFLEMYFERKNTNYIQNKMSQEVIKENQKNLLAINPFAINQCIEYSIKELTEEEKIINDIIEFNRIAVLKLDEYAEIFEEKEYERKRLNLVKTQMIKNYDKYKLSKVILFMISNLYQEIMENPVDITYNMIKSTVENEKVKNDDLVKFFISNDNFSGIIIGKFIDYNIKIKENRLQELKQKETKIYAKQRY